MAVFLIDYENIVSQSGMKGIQNLCRQDKLIMFYSDSCPNIRKDEMEIIINSECDFKVYKLARTGKNALDFYIAVETGALIEQGERQIAIVSNDKGFMAVLDYVQLKYQVEKICVCKAPSIERAITALNDPEDIDRRKRISEGMNAIGIVSSYKRYQEKKALEENIQAAFGSTIHEEKIPEIMQLLSDHRTKSLKEIYNGFLHTFGRVNGTEIYRTAKSLLPGAK